MIINEKTNILLSPAAKAAPVIDVQNTTTLYTTNDLIVLYPSDIIPCDYRVLKIQPFQYWVYEAVVSSC